MTALDQADKVSVGFGHSTEPHQEGTISGAIRRRNRRITGNLSSILKRVESSPSSEWPNALRRAQMIFWPR